MSAPKLHIKVLKSILSLSAELPEEYAKFWVTVGELHRRLIEGGVDRALTIEQLEYAIERANKDVFLSRRQDCGVIYYRPSRYAHDNGTPVDQRKRASGQRARDLPILPERGWFASNPATEGKLSGINGALIALSNRMEEGESICCVARTLIILMQSHT